MLKTVCQSVAWFKRYKTLKSVTVGRSVGRSVGRVAQLEKILIFSEKSLGLRPRSWWTTYSYVPFLSVRKFVSAVPTYWWSFDYIRIGMLKLSLLRRRLYCWAQNVQFVEISVVKSSGFWVQSWFSGLTWVSFRTCHAFVFECWELLC